MSKKKMKGKLILSNHACPDHKINMIKIKFPAMYVFSSFDNVKFATVGSKVVEGYFLIMKIQQGKEICKRKINKTLSSSSPKIVFLARTVSYFAQENLPLQ